MKRSLSIFASLLVTATGFLSSCDNKSTNSDGGGISSSTVPWNTSITYDTFKDSRDGKLYRTVKIGTQTWMAENLNYAGNGTKIGACYNLVLDSCATLGRRYTWWEAMAVLPSSGASPTGVQQGICPLGWHVPSDTEWTILTTVAGGASWAGEKLKSTSGWADSGIGIDKYGFRALAGGGTGLLLEYAGYGGVWWTATPYNSTRAEYRIMDYDDVGVGRWDDYKALSFSLRCVRDQ